MNDHSQVSLDYTANLLPTIILSNTQCPSLCRCTIIFPFPHKAKLDIKYSSINVFLHGLIQSTCSLCLLDESSWQRRITLRNKVLGQLEFNLSANLKQRQMSAILLFIKQFRRTEILDINLSTSANKGGSISTYCYRRKNTILAAVIIHHHLHPSFYEYFSY